MTQNCDIISGKATLSLIQAKYTFHKQELASSALIDTHALAAVLSFTHKNFKKRYDQEAYD